MACDSFERITKTLYRRSGLFINNSADDARISLVLNVVLIVHSVERRARRQVLTNRCKHLTPHRFVLFALNQLLRSSLLNSFNQISFPAGQTIAPLVAERAWRDRAHITPFGPSAEWWHEL